MPKRKIKESLFDSSEKEHIQLLHHFIIKIISNFDSFGKNRTEPLFDMYDLHAKKALVDTVFKPDEKKLKAMNNEDEDHYRRRKSRYWDETYHCTQGTEYLSEELENDTNTFCKRFPNGRKQIFRLLKLESIRIKSDFHLYDSKLYRKIQNTFQILGISENYIEFILFLFIRMEFSSFDDWISRSLNSNILQLIAKRVTGLGRSEYVQMIHAETKLIKFGVISRSHEKDDPVEIRDSFFHFLTDDSQETYGLNYLNRINEETHPISSFIFSKKDVSRLVSLLQDEGPCKILFYGSPGAGKTEFAKSLVSEVKRNLYKINNHKAEDIEEKRTALIVGTTLSKESKSVLLFDEADDILNEGGGGNNYHNEKVPEKKIWMNEFLDQMNGKLIIITNESDTIHESVLRRFDYSIEFFPAEPKQRLYYWNRILEIEKVKNRLSLEQIESLAHTYPAGVGGISTVVKAAKKICSQSSNDHFLSVIKDVMNKHTHLTKGKIQKPLLSATPYDPTILHVDANLMDLEKLIEEFQNKWDDSEESNLGSLCLLFYGKPGTGKTEYVRYLAKKHDLELIQKRGSDLQSPYVGVTEKLIARAFQQAEMKKSIFFLDEADSFFRSRDLASRSWEISQTNEFLTWMETFKGIFIASTNFVKDFDPAAMRRFAWKGEFKPLRREDKVLIVMKYFPLLKETFTFLEKETIKDIPELTVGDIRAVWNRFRFRGPNEISTEEVITSLQSEVSFKSNTNIKSIGF
ncbi:SpoVK/Ycf46/Vps4 family AAA+-type ATPase [Leptospira meyeri]|uniref:SpoVK/Ycf46/Vps4 family AAA+-type ATPase n=1 Tax=Leptospira meyeri TaxID=29508 RepID=A0A4R8MJ24_LEPME|nr:AAA family ATPase [Leptospira meyeri]TDY66732.1 SpoVK/Ycf46/Vps4 family AAA+-type ATPase [Leptospira meyeri]